MQNLSCPSASFSALIILASAFLAVLSFGLGEPGNHCMRMRQSYQQNMVSEIRPRLSFGRGRISLTMFCWYDWRMRMQWLPGSLSPSPKRAWGTRLRYTVLGEFFSGRTSDLDFSRTAGQSSLIAVFNPFRALICMLFTCTCYTCSIQHLLSMSYQEVACTKRLFHSLSHLSLSRE